VVVVVVEVVVRGEGRFNPSSLGCFRLRVRVRLVIS
jgi:hypothetical protein